MVPGGWILITVTRSWWIVIRDINPCVCSALRERWRPRCPHGEVSEWMSNRFSPPCHAGCVSWKVSVLSVCCQCVVSVLLSPWGCGVKSNSFFGVTITRYGESNERRSSSGSRMSRSGADGRGPMAGDDAPAGQGFTERVCVCEGQRQISHTHTHTHTP